MNSKKHKSMHAGKEVSAINDPAKRFNIVSVKLVKESSLLYKERSVKSPKGSYNLLKHFLEDKDREYFIVAALDIKNQPVSVHVCHVGSLNACIVHPREVMKSAILSNAASIIVGHNHPSGNPTPSEEDHKVTKRLKEAGEIIGIELLDHIIIGSDSYLSFEERGYL
ncbi:JAB domain-containing protein [Planomicrobium okeanokoites]|uniref:JAB domain-containing protein n=1 Tax=Planomicrobium okeanokoites TaxID=244 RepID=UPI0030F81C9F